ncbi:MAG TPA: GGDEF domain-containing protein, partial [Gemmatimonadales bacterium]|nr:GGDEF domain-containing protein [Gemmatimonadales bacterium]
MTIGLARRLLIGLAFCGTHAGFPFRRGRTPQLPTVRIKPPGHSWRSLLTADDPVLSYAGQGGELVVARIRLFLSLALLVVPVSGVLVQPWGERHAVGLAVLGCAAGIALAVLHLVRKGLLERWIGLASTVLDVTLVTAALVTFLIVGQTNAAVNSRLVFDCYFIAIAATCLRYDIRLCLLAGVLAIVQYAGLAIYADANWDVYGAVYRPNEYGMFDWPGQISRMVLLVIATVLAATVVMRGKALRRLSSMDRMTGVYNRGYFDERLSAEMSRARRQSEPLALVMVDVDHFKRFNDNYGHAAGDAGLRALTNLVRHSLRRSDLVARYGGEEFVIVLPVTTAEQAMDKMEAIREAVAQLPIRLPKQQTTALLTMSAGVAVFPDDGVTADELL